MPSVRQPPPLRCKAMKVLIAFFVTSCAGGRDDPVKRRQGMAFIENRIALGLPPKLVAEFCIRVLKYVERWVVKHGRKYDPVKMALGVVMDETIVGLVCPSGILTKLRPKDVNRIRGITKLKLKEKLPYSLNKMHLEHLTVFEYRNKCTDSDLRVIGGNCPKLNRVDVSRSCGVTDVGLAALASCTDLQYFSVRNCRNVSASGLNHFLLVHKSLRHLLACRSSSGVSGVAGFDFRMDENWRTELSVHELLKSFSILESFTDRHLLHILRRFPNLISLNITRGATVNLGIVKSFSKLTKIDFYACDGQTWTNFEPVLKFFGPQIDELKVQCEIFSIMQPSIDSIFRLCENLEILAVQCHEEWLTEYHVELVVPPFKNLREFGCRCKCLSRLQLREMPKLERLKALERHFDEDQIDSIILDNINFPKLKEIIMQNHEHSPSHKKHSRYFNRMIKTNNLHLKIIFCDCSVCNTR